MVPTTKQKIQQRKLPAREKQVLAMALTLLCLPKMKLFLDWKLQASTGQLSSSDLALCCFRLCFRYMSVEVKVESHKVHLPGVEAARERRAGS